MLLWLPRPAEDKGSIGSAGGKGDEASGNGDWAVWLKGALAWTETGEEA